MYSFRGLNPGHGERGSASLCRRLGGGAPSGGPGDGGQGAKPPEAESSLAFFAVLIEMLIITLLDIA